MREIKFRAWDNKHKEMIYNAEQTYDTGCGEGSEYHDSFGDVLGDKACTVMQYTGIKDMYGKEIYEGDIIYSEVEEAYFLVLWDNETARYVLEGIGLLIDFDNCYSDDLQVVGNKYENPELLEVIE